MKSPRPRAPATARMGISSMRLGISSGRRLVPCRESEPYTVISPYGSPASSGEVGTMSIRAPILCRALMTAFRVLFSPTWCNVRRDPGRLAAATIQKAAEEISAGTVKLWATGRAGPQVPTVSPSTVQGTPKWRNRRSVWSRVAAGWRTVVVPSANMPANRMALLTWALAMGSA